MSTSTSTHPIFQQRVEDESRFVTDCRHVLRCWRCWWLSKVSDKFLSWWFNQTNYSIVVFSSIRFVWFPVYFFLAKMKLMVCRGKKEKNNRNLEWLYKSKLSNIFNTLERLQWRLIISHAVSLSIEFTFPNNSEKEEDIRHLFPFPHEIWRFSISLNHCAILLLDKIWNCAEILTIKMVDTWHRHSMSHEAIWHATHGKIWKSCS